jgi:hypothetical protein
MTQAKENEVEALNVRRAVGPQQLLVYVFHGHLVVLTFQTQQRISTIHTAITADERDRGKRQQEFRSEVADGIKPVLTARCLSVANIIYLINDTK